MQIKFNKLVELVGGGSIFLFTLLYCVVWQLKLIHCDKKNYKNV